VILLCFLRSTTNSLVFRGPAPASGMPKRLKAQDSRLKAAYGLKTTQGMSHEPVAVSQHERMSRES
jgi:hypothetical protein